MLSQKGIKQTSKDCLSIVFYPYTFYQEYGNLYVFSMLEGHKCSGTQFKIKYKYAAWVESNQIEWFKKYTMVSQVLINCVLKVFL